VLVARFLSSDHSDIDPGFEIISLIRRQISRGTALQVLDVEPPYLPEQPVEELLENAIFWRHIAEEHGADMVVSGMVRFRTRDRSGFIREDVVSPTTGQKVRRTRYAERQEFDLGIRLWFFKGANGALLYEDTFKGKQVHEGKSTDTLQVFFDLYDLLSGDILGILVPQKRQDPRTIFTH
jgi:hypothetical protein